MPSALSRIIPMCREEGTLHELGDAGGGKRVKDREILILSQVPRLCTARAAMAQADLLCVRRPSRTWFSSSTRRSNADETAWSNAEYSEAGTRAALVPPAEEGLVPI